MSLTVSPPLIARVMYCLSYRDVYLLDLGGDRYSERDDLGSSLQISLDVQSLDKSVSASGYITHTRLLPPNDCHIYYTNKRSEREV